MILVVFLKIMRNGFNAEQDLEKTIIREYLERWHSIQHSMILSGRNLVGDLPLARHNTPAEVFASRPPCHKSVFFWQRKFNF